MTTVLRSGYAPAHDVMAKALPAHLLAGLLAYAGFDGSPRTPTGDFLRAVLSNNLMRAYMHADEVSTAAMRDIVTFVYNRLPSESWGSPERYAAWLAGPEEDGEEVIEYHEHPNGRIYVKGCAYCEARMAAGETFFPRHVAGSNCESGKRPHCTCDLCF